MSFPDLQNGLYNFTMELLGMNNASNLQLIQPAVPFPLSTTDTTVWNWMNQIPPFALVQSGGGGDQFFSDYQAVMSSLTPTVNINFQGDIGSAAYAAWNTYLGGLANPPAASQLPATFFNWAFTHGFYSVADKGSSDLSAMLLEPIYRAQLALQPYTTTQGVHQGKPPDWSLGYAQLVSQLNAAPSKSLTSTNVQSNTNTSNSWAAGGSSGGFFLWGGGSSSTASTISDDFASQAVSVSMSVAHALTFVPIPGAWYDSGAFGLAFSSQSGSPWNPAMPEVTWAKTFGSAGNMQRFASSLILVSGLKFSATSAYAFGSAERTTITQNSSAGFWPFYSSSSSSSITTTHSFNQAGNLTIETSSVGSTPTLIGMIVIPAARYLGYANVGRTTFQQLVAGSGLSLAKVLA